MILRSSKSTEEPPSMTEEVCSFGKEAKWQIKTMHGLLYNKKKTVIDIYAFPNVEEVFDISNGATN